MILNGLRLRSGHIQRKNYFKFRDIGTPAGVPISHFHRRGRKGEWHLPRLFLSETVALRTSCQASERKQQICPQRRHFRRKQALKMPFISTTSPVKKAFVALRRVRQTRNKNSKSSNYAQSNAEGISNHFFESRQPVRTPASARGSYVLQPGPGPGSRTHSARWR